MSKRTTVVKEEFVSPDDSPHVVSYRVGQLEKAVVAGFKEHNLKLDSLINNFATKEEVTAVNRRIDNYTWYWRAVVTGLILTIAGVIAALVQRISP